MFKAICNFCSNELRQMNQICPFCQAALVWEGSEKNVVETLDPDCFIHRYSGSDLLEPAVFLKKGKVNIKTALPVPNGVKTVTLPEAEVFARDDEILEQITKLRRQRCKTMQIYDEKIGALWSGLKQYSPATS